MTFLKSLTIFFVLLCAIFDLILGTGSLYDPPSRPVMWKYGYPTEKNYDYMLLNCGGEKQPEDGPTQCGVCGDYVNGTRDHELGGKYGTGVIGRYYPPGIKEFHIKVELNSFEGGFFEFRLCPANDKPVTQACLDDYLLPIQQGYVNGTPFRYYPKNAGDFRLTIAIPPKMACDRCVLQWRYHTGNSWGTDPLTGLSGTGKGLQKDFYNCADIRIGGIIPDSVLANPFFAPADNRLQNGRIKTSEFMTDSVSVDPVKPTIVDHVSPGVLGALQEFENMENLTTNSTSGEIGIDRNTGWMFGVKREPKVVADTASGLNLVNSGDAGNNQTLHFTNEMASGNHSDMNYVFTNFGLISNNTDQRIGMVPEMNSGGNIPFDMNTLGETVRNNAGVNESIDLNSNISMGETSNGSYTNVNVSHEKMARLMIDIGNKNTVNSISSVETKKIGLDNTLDLTNTFNLPSQNVPSTKTTGFSDISAGDSNPSFDVSATALDSGLSSGSIIPLNEPDTGSTAGFDSTQLFDVTPKDTTATVGTAGGSTQMSNSPTGDSTSSSGILRGSTQLLNLGVGGTTSNSNLQGIKNNAPSSSDGLNLFTSRFFSNINIDPSQPSIIFTETKEQPGVTPSTILNTKAGIQNNEARGTMTLNLNTVFNTEQNRVPQANTAGSATRSTGLSSAGGFDMIGDSINFTRTGQDFGLTFTNQADKSITGTPDSSSVPGSENTSQIGVKIDLPSTDTMIVDNVTTSSMINQGSQIIVEPLLEVRPTNPSFVSNADMATVNLERGITDVNMALNSEPGKTNQGDILILYNKATTQVQDVTEKEQAAKLPIAFTDLPQNPLNQGPDPTPMSEIPVMTGQIATRQLVLNPTIDYSTLSDPLINSESTVNLAAANSITTNSRPITFDPFNLKQGNNESISVNESLSFDTTQTNELVATGSNIMNIEKNINLAPIIRNEIRSDSVSPSGNTLFVENIPTTSVSRKDTFIDPVTGTDANIPLSLDSLGVTDTSFRNQDIIIENAKVQTDGTTSFNSNDGTIGFENIGGTTGFNSIDSKGGTNNGFAIESNTDVPSLDKSSLSTIGVILDAAEPNSQSNLATVTKTKNIADGTERIIVSQPEIRKDTNTINISKAQINSVSGLQTSGKLVIKNPTIASDINSRVVTDIKDTPTISLDIKLPTVRESTKTLNEAVGGIVESGDPGGPSVNYKVTGGNEDSTTDIMTFMKDVRATKELMNRKFFSKKGPDGTMISINQDTSTDIQKQLKNFNLTDIPTEKVLETNVQVGVDGVLRPSFGQRQDENTRFRNLNRSPDTSNIRTLDAERRISTSSGRSGVNRSDRRERVQIDPRTGMQIRVRNIPPSVSMNDRNPGMVLSGRELRMDRMNRGTVERRGGVSNSGPSSSVMRSNGIRRTSVGSRPAPEPNMVSRDRIMSNQVSRRTNGVRQPQTVPNRRPMPPRSAAPPTPTRPVGPTFGPVSGFRTGDFGPPGFPPIVSGGRFFPPGAFDTGTIGGTTLLGDGGFSGFPIDGGRGFPFVGGGAFPFGGFPVGGSSPVLTPALGSGPFDPFMGGTLTPTGFTGF